MLLKLQPITTKTKGGHKAIITALDTDDVDCIIGEVEIIGVLVNKSWSSSYFARNSPEEMNLDPNDPNIKELAEFMSRAERQ